MKNINGILFFVLFLMLFPCFCMALDSSVNSSQEQMQIAAVTTKEELLLFWDEKDLYVQSATRSTKPISQVAENMTVITAEDIEDMNAHTVAEVLNRVTGVFVEFLGYDYGGTAISYIQGSAERHVLVLLDGFAWNFLNDGHAETMNIPVGIIERIEIVKGPASSAWGSSLGGVINIITKRTGDTLVPSGHISGSYGSKASQDYSAGVTGRAWTIGYYLFGENQHSDGLRGGRSINKNSFYSKFGIPISKDLVFDLTFGYNYSSHNEGDVPSADLKSKDYFKNFFGTLSIDAKINKELNLKASFYTFNSKFTRNDYVLGLGFYGPQGDLFFKTNDDEKTTGGSIKFDWKYGIQTVVLGADVSHSSMDQINTAGPLLQSYGVPKNSRSEPDIDKWAIFFNDTITQGRFSLIPGIRFDHSNISGSFTSPSLGATYKLAEKTVIRASIARGFNIPPLSFSSAGGLFYDPNPSLKPEKVWSYQAGIESGITDYLWLKATVFYHDMKDEIVKDYYAGGPPGCVGTACNDLFVNKGSVRRQGVELEAETAPFYNTSIKTGFAFVSINPSDGDSTVNYLYNLALKYDDKKSFMAELFGHYLWWNTINTFFIGKYDTFIWDLNLKKTIFKSGKTGAEIFLTGHNIFNGSLYTLPDRKNPRRWAEAGVRFRF